MSVLEQEGRHHVRRIGRGARRGVPVAALLAAAAVAQAQVPGLERQHPLDEDLVGRVLIDELRCGACHPGIGTGTRDPLPGPDLAEVGWRLTPDYLVRFLADPAGTQPGTKMPAFPGTGTALEREAIATALAHYLVQRAAREAIEHELDADQVAAGRALFHSVGCVACHPPRQPALPGGRMPGETAGAVELGHVPGKYRLESLAQFLFQPARVRPAGRMPDLGLTRTEAWALASYLLDSPPSERGPFRVHAQLAHTGGQYFDHLGCAACHALEGHAAPPLVRARELDPARGCLAAPTAGTPHYALHDRQRTAIAGALQTPGRDLSDRERIDVTLVALNCIACHVRGDYGGVLPALDAYFGTSEHDLGNEARIPPQLTGAGAKLQDEWMRKVLFDSATARPYMHARMPQFGETNLGELPELLARVDTVEPFELPLPEGEEARAARDAGRLLLGTTGLACVSCHDFNGQPSPGFGGVDLINSTERLRPSWFARFLIEPQTYRPGIVMPESWPGGVAAHPTILDGDTAAQLRAIWFFLSEGRTARNPDGIRPVPTRLVATDRVRTYRGRSRIAGFRGVAVGFPGGLNYAFNARTGTLTGLWRGDFVSVRWDGQGAGDFNPSGRAVSLAQDLSFFRLASERDPWPLRPHMDEEHPVDPDPLYPRNRGYRFRGYSLDEDLVPTLRYESGAVTITDRSVAEDGILRRTLGFSAPGAETLWFRALTGALEAQGEREFVVSRLRVVIPEVPTLIRPFEDGSELLLELTIPAGSSSLTIDYEILP